MTTQVLTGAGVRALEDESAATVAWSLQSRSRQAMFSCVCRSAYPLALISINLSEHAKGSDHSDHLEQETREL